MSKFLPLILATWFVAIGCGSLSAGARAAEQHQVAGEAKVVRFGVLAFRSTEETQARWQPLVDHLNKTGLSRRLVLEALNYPELDAAVRAKRVDFVLTQPAHYTVLMHREGLHSPLATLLERESGHVLASFGGTILVRAGRADLRELADLRGKRIAIMSQWSLGAYQAQALELLQLGIRLPQDATLVESGGLQDEVIDSLLAGNADAAFVRTGVLESLVREGKVDPAKLAVLKAPAAPDYPLALSTRLYPQWALAAMPWADADLARQLAAAVLALPHGGAVAEASRIAGFTVPGNYRTVEEMMRVLRMPPFEQAEFHIVDVWERYRWPIVILLFAGSFIVVLALRLAHGRRELEVTLGRLNDAQRMAKTGNWELNVAANQLVWSDEIFRIFEIDQGSLEPTYQGFLAAIHPDDRDAVNAAYKRSLVTREPYSIEHRLLFPDGRIKHVLEQCRTIFGADGKALRSVGTVQDISERKIAEQALLDAETRATGYVDNAPGGIFVADPKGRYVNVNPAACELLGYTREELLSGMTIADISAADDMEAYFGLFTEVLRTGNGEFDIPLRRKDGSVINVALRATVLPSGEVIGFATDVTEQRATQNALSVLATTLTPLSGDIFHQAVCRHLADALGLDYVFVGRINGTATGINVVAGWGRGAPMTPFAYDLADTPCFDVMKLASAIYPSLIQSLFPKHEMLSRMEIESYAGSLLFDKQKRPMGILVGLGTRPINQQKLAERLMGVFVDSVSAEMMRTDIERQLHESEHFVASLIENSGTLIFAKDCGGRYRLVNRKWEEVTGHSRDKVIGRLDAEIFGAVEAIEFRANDLKVMNGETTVEIEETLGSGADARYFLSTKFPMRNDSGQVNGICGIATEITQRKKIEAKMREALVVFNASNQGITTTDADGRITSVNPAFTRITGFTADEAIGRTPSILKSGRHDAAFYESMWSTLRTDGIWEGEVWNRRRDGQIYPEWLTISSVTDADGKVTDYVSLFSDITERKQQEEEIWRQANFDALTGLANRNLFADRLERAIAQARRKEQKVGIAFLDLDGFKWINDTLGHDFGDELLVEVARRLRHAVREQDTVARLGGDEFTVVINDLTDPQDMLSVGEKLVGTLRDPFALGGNTHQLSGSIGITLYPDDGEDVQTLLKNADIAMYKAKQGGKNRFQFYAHHMQIDARSRMQMESELRDAIAGNQLLLHYQPIVDADSGELVGAEALIRWQHPANGLMSPLDFIPVAEDSGLIIQIGEWALREAARQWASWRAKGHPLLRISVNISSVQFRADNLRQLVAEVLHEFDVDPGWLVLEITESVLMDGSAEAEARMREIKGLGVGYALDDFGTGYSSLSYLKRFPVDIVKIDRSFVNDCPDDHNDARLVEAIVNMAHSLDLRVTAEGVETEAQFEFLRELGCDYLQGYLVGRPLPPESFEVVIERRQLLLPTDGASIEETRFLAALRQDDLDVDDWLERLLDERHRDLVGYRTRHDWVSRGLDLRQVVRSHLEWRRRLNTFIGMDSQSAAMSVEDAGSSERCILGGWIAAHRKGEEECFGRLEHAHQGFHRLAGQIVDDHLNGHRTLARRALMGVAFRKASREVVTALIGCYRELQGNS